MINKIPDGALDEQQKDQRDWVGSSPIHFELEELPNEFVIDDSIYVSQATTGYTMSCTAQAVTNASNGGRKIKCDSKRDNSFDLWDTMLDKGLGSEDRGAYVIDAIKEAKNAGLINGYYQTNSLLDILNAIYSTNLIVTGATKINWTKSKDGLVKEISSGSGHAFCIIGWDKNKQIANYKPGAIKCKNSYGKSYQDKGCFWIPFHLVEQILFFTKKAIIVVPEWKSLNREERFDKYLELKEKYDRSKKANC